ncbi:hypothetical protein CC1G_15768 [Coprinopsis cinerea okayama7|uniref:Uncharacterized protein n=1 Tax=Coprinopsis cinerea (strain Okayama-7 / 130 / ATCC MYA-4618 / FGSC 9003) TaxID=240176 RepID=D6RQY2_COPC7|nr:hypothetical protein CC1G_15768 [Coprinopsis cinerea okayama7\|eukprot:XP_002910049.1 hypothetical protein CC1G_15768 [Coprinopsis cinerea okayama7\
MYFWGSFGSLFESLTPLFEFELDVLMYSSTMLASVYFGTAVWGTAHVQDIQSFVFQWVSTTYHDHPTGVGSARLSSMGLNQLEGR